MLTPTKLAKPCNARSRLLQDAAPESVAALAAGVGLADSHFITLFRAVFGETPQQCRIRGRLTRARHLLALTDESVTQICLEVGFASLGSFSDRFACEFGVPPCGYRHKARVHVRWIRASGPPCPLHWLRHAA